MNANDFGEVKSNQLLENFIKEEIFFNNRVTNNNYYSASFDHNDSIANTKFIVGDTPISLNLSDYYFWCKDTIIDLKVVDNTVEVIYQANQIQLLNGDKTIYKIIYSWQDGKLQTTRKEGRYIPPTKERYEFD